MDRSSRALHPHPKGDKAVISTRQMFALGIAMGVGLSVAQYSMHALEKAVPKFARSVDTLIEECVARKGNWSTGSNGEFQSCYGIREAKE